VDLDAAKGVAAPPWGVVEHELEAEGLVRNKLSCRAAGHACSAENTDLSRRYDRIRGRVSRTKHRAFPGAH